MTKHSMRAVDQAARSHWRFPSLIGKMPSMWRLLPILILSGCLATHQSAGPRAADPDDASQHSKAAARDALHPILVDDPNPEASLAKWEQVSLGTIQVDGCIVGDRVMAVAPFGPVHVIRARKGALKGALAAALATEDAVVLITPDAKKGEFQEITTKKREWTPEHAQQPMWTSPSAAVTANSLEYVELDPKLRPISAAQMQPQTTSVVRVRVVVAKDPSTFEEPDCQPGPK